MKKLILIIFYLLAVFGAAYSQTCDNVKGKGGVLNTDRECAPVVASFDPAFFLDVDVDPAKVKIQINWGDGTIDGPFVTNKVWDTRTGRWKYYLNVMNHTYQGGSNCQYVVAAAPIINGVLCGGETIGGPITVWDKDDKNGGQIVIAPKHYQACPGQEFTVLFKDNSIWNCTPASRERDKMNKFSRWTRFTYGTSGNGQTTTITGVKVGGVVQPNGYQEPVKFHEYTGTNEILFPAHTALPVTVPATAKVGEIYQVKLENWNLCNPYDPNAAPEVNEGTAVVTYAYIEIVQKPEASITAPANVCPGNDVIFEGGSSVNNVDFLWKIYSDEQGTTLLKQSTSKNFTLTGGFATAGKKKVTLLVKRKSPYDGSCYDLNESEIVVSDAPTADPYLNGAAGTELKLCHDPVAFPAGQTVEYKFELGSANKYEYELYLLKRNSTSDSLDASGNRVGTGLVSITTNNTPSTATHTSTFTKPGMYRARIRVKDNASGCPTEKESTVIVYDTPVAAFSSNVICNGEATSFTDLSSLKHKINGDYIKSYLWEFGDGTGVTSTDKNPSYTFSAIGPYDVKLTVTTNGGCKATVTNEVTVYALPKASLTSNYTTPICPGEEVEFTNASFAANESTIGAGKVVYTLEYTDGTNSVVEPFVPGVDMRSLKFRNTTNNPITYSVKMRAKSDEGCEKVSDPISIVVNPGAKAGFSDPDYNIFNENCTDIAFNFKVDNFTLALGGDKHIWKIYKNSTFYEEIVTTPGDPYYEKLEYIGTNNDSKGLLLKVELHVEFSNPDICVDYGEQVYLIQPRPTPGFTYHVREDCETNQTFIDVEVDMAGVKDLDWQFSIPPKPESDTPDNKFTLVYDRPLAAAGTVPVSLRLNKENFFGCWQEDYHEEIIDLTPSPIQTVDLQLNSPVKEICKNGAIEFENTTSAPSGTTYEFYLKRGIEPEQLVTFNTQDFGDPEGDGLAGKFSYTFKEAGIYQVRIKANTHNPTSACEKYSDFVKDIIVYEDPKPDFDLDKKEGCAILTSSIINNIQGSTTNQWIVTDITEVSPGVPANVEILNTTDPINSIDFPNTSLSVKEYEVKLIATSANNCTAESTKRVKVFPAATATFNVTNLEVCAPFEVEVTNTSVNPAGTTYTWNWSDGTSTTVLDTDPAVLTHTFTNPSYLDAQLRYVTLTATTPDGCKTTSAPVEVKLRPQVKAAFTPNVTEGCAPLSLYILQNNSQGADSYNWEIREKGTTGQALYTGNASLPNNDPAFPEFLTNGGNADKIYEITLTATNSGSSCSNTQTVEVKVKQGAKADFGMDYTSALCNGESTVTFSNLNIQSGVEYTWSWGDGEPNEITTTEASIEHTFNNNSTNRVKVFEVTLTAKNLGSNCTNQVKKTITVNPMVQALVRPDRIKGCAPLKVNFTNQSQNVDINGHDWLVRLAGTTATLDQSNLEQPTFTLDNHTAGILQYEIVYTGTSSTGCKDTEVHLVEVYPTPEPDFVTDSLRLRLPNSTFKIENRTSHKENWTHHWDFGDGTTSSEVDPGSHTYETYGKYKIALTVTNGVCSETYEQEVIINEILPIVDFESIPVSGCWPLVVNFKNNSKYADENKYRWDFGDGEGYATSKNPNYTYHKPGEYTVTLTATNAEGELAIARHSIVTVFERPRISFELRDDVVFVPGDPLYVANHTKGASSYFWDFGDGTTYTDFEPVHYYQEPGVYTISLIATNEWGCADTLVMDEVVTAKAGGKAKIPNAFTPNAGGSNGGDIGAGNNDVFFPVLDGGVTRYNMKIYNRWGELLFESNKREIGWDGYYKGQLCKADVYVFRLSVEFSDGKKMEQLGDFTLIR